MDQKAFFHHLRLAVLAGVALTPAFGGQVDARSGIPVYRTSDFHSRAEFIAAAKAACPKGIAVGRMALTGSMRGTIEGGDFVLINQSFPYSRLRIGDIVAFHCDTIVIHRVIGEAPARTGQLIDRHALKTQGDALPRPDPTVLNCDTYIGKVTAIVHNDLRLTDADEIGRTWASGK